MSFRLDRPKPVSVRYTRHERKGIEKFMNRRNMNGLGSGLRLMIRLAIATDEILNKGDYKYVKPYTDAEIETMISNLDLESKKKLVEALTEELGPDYVRRLREMNRNEIVDKDTREV